MVSPPRLFLLGTILLVIGALEFIYSCRHQLAAQPFTAEQAVAPVAVLALTHCAKLAGWLVVYANGKVAVLPPLPPKPHTEVTAVEVGGEDCGVGA